MEKRMTGAAFNFGVQRISHVLKGLIMAQIFLFVFTTQSWAVAVTNMKVNCDKNQTITNAISKSTGTPLLIEVSGTCTENVVIYQDDVTLVSYASSGAAINAFDPQQVTIDLKGTRAVIKGLIVSGGYTGIKVNGNAEISYTTVQANGLNLDGDGILIEGSATINNTTIQGNGFNGIRLIGGNMTVDKCQINSNKRHGIAILGGTATITNSTISLNEATGIAVAMSGSARIGFNKAGSAAGNTIIDNKGSGIMLSQAGAAQIAGNTISGNGSNPSSLFERAGILVTSSSAAFLGGGNNITNNVGSGVLATQSASVQFHDGRLLALQPLAQYNIISGNGLANDDCEVRGAISSTLEIAFTNIIGNATGPKTEGLCLQRRSTARLNGYVTISNNLNGIVVNRGGGLFMEGGNTVAVTNNTNWGIRCIRATPWQNMEPDHESSIYPYYNADGIVSTIGSFSGNGLGAVEPLCTSF